MRWILLVAASGLLSCSGTFTGADGRSWRVNPSKCCAVPADADPRNAELCEQRGCQYGAEPTCGGIPPPPEVEARLRQEQAACRTPCACVCDEVEACRNRL